MPASTIANRRAFLPDAALAIRDQASAAISATTSETGLLYYLESLIDYKVVIQTSAYSGYTATTALWTVTLEIANLSNFTGATTLATITTAGTASLLEIPLSGQYLAELLPGLTEPSYIRTTATKTGTPGSFDYWAYLATNKA